ncbi:MAG: oxidoreductase [Acidobacteria bacterium]|nr:oxidoreductase [Acidobacteriota bacterium]
MTLASIVRRNEYRDSGTLMALAAKLQALPGITRTAAIMATPKNVELLTRMGFPAADATSSDLLITMEGDSKDAVDAAIAQIPSLLERKNAGSGSSPRGPAEARPYIEHANLAVISVPGPFAAREARKAMRAGRHVFLFSNDVSLEDEIALKAEARERGLLLMGPDCGTAIIDGTPIGFANRVRRGAIGIVGASGTGIQEISTLVHRLGRGVSHAIGTGSRDLSDAVGGSSTLQGIDLLAHDAATEVMVLVSKPPSPSVAARVREHAAQTGKRIVECFLGGEKTLEDAALEACGLDAPSRVAKLTNVVGLFSGGTLASEARRITNGDVVDLGEDEYTRGRPHPMIDPTIRIERIAQVPADATLLLDIVLGEGAHPDPAGALIPAIVARGGRTFASVTGTDDDPQNRSAQVRKLREAGVVVCRSNAAAARGDESELLEPAIVALLNEAAPILGKPLVAINLGLASFADTFAQVIRTDWRPPAGGDEELARILDELM